jgi:hypothetical protein
MPIVFVQLIWRLPGFIRPRRTAGATHRFAESYERLALHISIVLPTELADTKFNLNARLTLALYRMRAFRMEGARARCSGARSIKPLEGSRWRLRRMRQGGRPMEFLSVTECSLNSWRNGPACCFDPGA